MRAVTFNCQPKAGRSTPPALGFMYRLWRYYPGGVLASACAPIGIRAVCRPSANSSMIVLLNLMVPADVANGCHRANTDPEKPYQGSRYRWRSSREEFASMPMSGSDCAAAARMGGSTPNAASVRPTRL